MAYEYVQPGESILDIGIGTGLSSVLFNKAGLEVYGIDSSGEMLSVCREKGFAKDLKTYDLIEGHWPYEDCRFHHAIACGVFHFFKSLDVFFMETSRILKNDGIFCFTVAEPAGGETEHVNDDYGIVIYSHDDSYVDLMAERYGFIRMKSISYLTYTGTDKIGTARFKGIIFKKKDAMG